MDPKLRLGIAQLSGIYEELRFRLNKRGLRGVIVAALLVGAVALISGCGGSSSSSTSSSVSSGGSTSSSGSKAPIVIGAAIAQTGLLSAYDVPAFSAFKMRINEINAAGGIAGHRVKLVIGDTKSVIANGASVAKTLLSQGAQIMVVSCDYDFAAPAATAAQAAGEVSMSLCAQSPLFGAQGIGDKAYTVSEDATTEGGIAAAFARKHKSLGNTFLLVDETIQYDRSLCQGYKKAFTSLGGKIAGEADYKGTDSSFATEITKIQSSGADSVMLCSIPPAGSSMLRQIRGAGISVPILSGGGMDGTYWVSAVPHLDNFYITTQASIFGNDPDPAVNAFVKRYTQETGKAPTTSFAVVAYSVAQALTDALQETGGDASGTALKAKLDAFHNHSLLVGPTTYTSAVHIPTNRPEAILEYSNDVPKFLVMQPPLVDVGLGL